MSVRWRAGCSACSATSTRASCRPLGRNAPSSSWSTCGRCRRSWRGCTSAWMCVWRSSRRSRRSWWLTGTWTSCWHTWRSSAAPFRSCTWPRAPALRRPRPDDRRLRGGGPAARGGRGGAAGPTAVTRGSPSPTAPAAILFDRAQRRRDVIGLRVTSSGGALIAAMEAAEARGPREDGEERRRLLRAVTRLQAGVRGFLLRRRLRAVRAEYEEVVKDIEGELSELRWTGRCLRRPVFVAEKPVKEQCSPTQEAVSSDKDSTGKTQQELGVSKPERDWGSSNRVKPMAQLRSDKDLSPMGECSVASSANLGAVTGKGTEKRCSAPAESKEWQNSSSISSVWDSTDLEPGSLKASPEIPLANVKELPRTQPGLQSFRNHLIMELLWLQQAIDSRKNYLKLKQRLESPDS